MSENSTADHEELRIADTPTLIVSELITLRPADLDDTEIFMALKGKNYPLLTPWFSSSMPPKTADERRKVMAGDLEETTRHERYWWMIEYNDELVGKIDIHNMHRPTRIGEIGYWLDDDFTGKGIVTESTRAVLNWAFNDLNFLRIEIICAINNTASSAIPERLGIRREAILRQANINRGEIQDMAIYAILADNWPPKAPVPALPPKEVRVDNEILLRPILDSDRDDMWKALNSGCDYLGEYLPWMSDYKTEDDHTIGFNTRRREQDNFDGSRGYLLEYKGQLAGTVGFRAPNRDNVTEVGYWLRQDLQGQGIMTRSVESVITMLFVEVGLHRVKIRAATSNLRSRGIPERLGFKHEGTMRDGGFVNNEYLDLEIYSMLDHEWLTRSQDA